MRRLVFLTLVTPFAVAGGISALSLGTVMSADPAPPATAPTESTLAIPTTAATVADPVEVNIVEPPLKPPKTWKYEPATLTVKVGTTVTWANTGAVVHTVTADDGKTFNSGLMRPKASFSFTPKSAGTFAYHCIYHPWMKATIIVQP